ncbi:acetylornithine deacetylase [Pseudomonas sp. LTJR-52]|uniref:acetylornithine deacetylase n=1 Tax=Pseudomonas sp. LTJR-52 TaxID=2479392 RepID=UPI000EFA5388|nr:acetylornithine deacetylase [Pseudomonas sp. LTJR-52]AYN96783.1 acetylornithine deacetylase [Pseudomonas sp. LTJR-52]
MNTRSITILKRLIGFETVSVDSNLPLIGYVRDLLEARGIACQLIHDATGKKANLFASVGPADVPGVVLSGHTDVVPVAGQAWTLPPFTATVLDGRVYGRGSCDMKGFVACAINALLEAAQQPLRRPLQLALSYDEEIGCVGVRRLLEVLALLPVRPFLCLIGEPTSMQLAVGHKGKGVWRVHCRGLEGHSSLAPRGVNAIYLATDFIQQLRTLQTRLETAGASDDAYDVPYTTVHTGLIQGGKAINIVPSLCTLDFEIRHLPADDPNLLIDDLRGQAERLIHGVRDRAPNAAIEIEKLNSYPGLNTHPTVDAVKFVESFTQPGTQKLKVAFGTEGGLFADRLDVPVVVCGPGSIEQAHKPDEYVALEQLAACDALLGRLVNALC